MKSLAGIPLDSPLYKETLVTSFIRLGSAFLTKRMLIKFKVTYKFPASLLVQMSGLQRMVKTKKLLMMSQKTVKKMMMLLLVNWLVIKKYKVYCW